MSKDSAQTVSSGSPVAGSAQEAAALGNRCWLENRYDEAMAHFRQAVDAAPEVARYHVHLGQCAWMLKQFDVAEVELQEAFRLAPDDAFVHRVLAEFSIAQSRPSRALFHSARACELNPQDPEVVVTRASILCDHGQIDEAWALIEPLLKAGICSAPMAVLYGRLAPHLGREAAALSCIEYLLRVPSTTKHGAIRLHFAAAALLDRAGRFDEAFEHARLGKQTAPPDHDPDHFSQWIDFHFDYFTPEKLKSLPRATHGNRRPVFILGMPRTGMTLVEQILASHPDVFAAGELRLLPAIRRGAWTSDWAAEQPYPEMLDAITPAKADELAATYLSALAAIDADAVYVTDKMPGNFLLLGLIAMLFPESHVIHCTRDPLDTCLSCYMTYFAAGRPYSHDLRHLAAFYRDYKRLMDHWTGVLEYPLIEVNYETLVGDFEGQSRRLIERVGLPWDERCLSLQQGDRPAPAPRAERGRRPVDASSVGRWRNYAKHLGPLIERLGDSFSGDT